MQGESDTDTCSELRQTYTGNHTHKPYSYLILFRSLVPNPNLRNSLELICFFFIIYMFNLSFHRASPGDGSQ